MIGLLIFLSVVGALIWGAAHAKATPYDGYTLESNGYVRWVGLWTCKECGTITKCYRKGSGFKCRNRKCKGDRDESVAHWRERRARGIPYTGATEFVPNPRQSSEMVEMNYHHSRTMLAYKARGLTYKQALIEEYKKRPFLLGDINNHVPVDETLPEMPWPNFKV